MTKLTNLHTCLSCDAQYPKWVGRCEQCGKWGTVSATPTSFATSADALPATAAAKKPLQLSALQETPLLPRITTGIAEIDTVLGGGFMPGSLLLLSGDPGVGKSTLALLLARAIPNTILISAEESTEQVRARALRLALHDLLLLHETDADTIAATIAHERPTLAIIDSIQTIRTAVVESEAGSVNQIRACAGLFLQTAKQTNSAIILIGHVTKDGAVAGPKTLEHLVDVVLALEGDDQHAMRILRATKNRFGSTDEVGIFTMSEQGLTLAQNPATSFLTEKRTHTPGSVIAALLDGKQPLLVEVQALTTRTSYGYPQRRSSGFDLNRLQVLLAVLQQRAQLPLAQYDVHVNIVGGIKIRDTAADLAVASAIISSLKNIALSPTTIAFGEIGLAGEVRTVKGAERRVRTAEQFGFTNILAGTTVRTISELVDRIDKKS